MFKFCMDKKTVNRDEIIDNLKYSLEIAKENEWLGQQVLIEDFLKKVKEKNYCFEPYIDMKKLEDKNDKKNIQVHKKNSR